MDVMNMVKVLPQGKGRTKLPVFENTNTVIFPATVLQDSSQFVYCSYDDQPVASNGKWMLLPYLPGHFYVNIPIDGDKGGLPSVDYLKMMPPDFDKKYPFFAAFKLDMVGF